MNIITPEPAGAGLHPFDLADRVVRRPDDGAAGLDDKIANLGHVLWNRADGQDVARIGPPFFDAEPDIVQRLRFGVRDMHLDGDAKLAPVRGVAVRGGAFFIDPPVLGIGGQRFIGMPAEGKKAEPVPSGKQRAGG